jgi:hypothetical protein
LTYRLAPVVELWVHLQQMPTVDSWKVGSQRTVCQYSSTGMDCMDEETSCEEFWRDLTTSTTNYQQTKTARSTERQPESNQKADYPPNKTKTRQEGV